MKSTLTLVTALLLAPLIPPSASAAETPRTNVVFILIDDLSHYGVTAYGADKLGFQSGDLKNTNIAFRTPRMDRLASEGLRCDNAYAYPLCEPSRIALMSGKHNNRNLLQRKAQHASDITFGDVFKRAGYATCIVGKWKQTRGTKEIPGKDYLYQFGWDEFCCFDVVNQGRRFFNPNLVINGQIKNYGKDIDPATGRRWFGPDICNRFALDFIKRHKEQPFLLYYPLTLVHKEDEGDYHIPTPDTVPASAFDEFDDDYQNPAGDGRAGRKLQPGADDRGRAKVQVEFDPFVPDMKYFPDMIRYTDKLIGSVIDQLESLGLRENTLVVIMADNGTQRPFVHMLPDGKAYPGLKGATTDNGMHVPLIFTQPGRIPAGKSGSGRTYDGLVDVADIYPTLCAAAGIAPPNAGDLDGISLWPQVMGEADPHRQSIYVWYDETINVEKNDVVFEFAFDKRFKRYAPHPGFPRGRFFDLQADPLELCGTKFKGPNFGIWYRSGLDLDQLTSEQQAAFDHLGEVLAANRHVPVTGLKIRSRSLSLTQGQTATLQAEILPANATRNNVIWESSDPAIASIDKFGVITAHKPGDVKVSVYSWDDAHPLANNAAETFSRKGFSDSIAVLVHN